MFAAPASTSEGVKPADLENHLCIFEPLEYKTNVSTSMGESDAIALNVIDLDANEVHNDVLLFSAYLRGALKPLVGQKVLARIKKGVAKPGKTAPWILEDATQDAAAVARAQAYLTQGLQAPAAPAPAPAAAPAPTNNVTVNANGVNLNDPAIQALMAQLGAQAAQ